MTNVKRYANWLTFLTILLLAACNGIATLTPTLTPASTQEATDNAPTPASTGEVTEPATEPASQAATGTQGSTQEPTLADTPTPTAAPATATGVATTVASATSGPTASPLPTIVVPAPKLANGDFEGCYHDQAGNPIPMGCYHDEPGGQIFDGWSGWFCDVPYTARCLVPVEWNPYEPYMGTPEYKLERAADRLVRHAAGDTHKQGLTAQEWFCAGRVCRAGVKQVVNGLVPGGIYDFATNGQMWIADGAQGPNPASPKFDQPCVRRDAKNQCYDWGSDPYHSDRATEDDLTAGYMLLGVDLSCGTNAFDPGIQWSQDYGYYQGLYDHYAPMHLTFVAQKQCATLYIGSYSRFAKGHNNFYTDEATLTVIGGSNAPLPAVTPAAPTPTPVGSIKPTAQATTVEVTPLGPQPDQPEGPKSWDATSWDLAIGATASTSKVLKVRNSPDATSISNIVDTWGPGTRPAYAMLQMKNGDLWACVTITCTQLVAVKVNGAGYAQVNDKSAPLALAASYLFAPVPVVNLITSRSNTMPFPVDLSPQAQAIIGEVLIVLLAVGAIIASVISKLKADGKISDGDAGKWNAGLSSIATLLTAVAAFFRVAPELHTDRPVCPCRGRGDCADHGLCRLKQDRLSFPALAWLCLQVPVHRTNRSDQCQCHCQCSGYCTAVSGRECAASLHGAGSRIT
jgi:hypothetical protein